jgi:peptidoglycan/xylan/chitin deacetylase (PgdA/CDA1 family)
MHRPGIKADNSTAMMNNFLKHTISTILFSAIPLKKWLIFTKTDLLIAYYHMVGDYEVPHIKHLYPYKSVKSFIDDLEFLRSNFNPIQLRDLIDNIHSGTPLPRRAFLLTFDDGFREIHDIVAPILLRKGIPATFLVNSNFTDNLNLCFQHNASLIVEHLLKNEPSKTSISEIDRLLPKQLQPPIPITSRILAIKYSERMIINKIATVLEIDTNDYLQKEQPYLTNGQIRNLIKKGFAIGAHSIDHPLYADLTLDEQIRQTTESMRFVKETFHLDYGAFAFPHSDVGVSKEYFRRIASTNLVDISFGTSGIIEDSTPNHYQRFSLERPLLPAKNLISYQIARRLWRQIRQKHVIKRQN